MQVINKYLSFCVMLVVLLSCSTHQPQKGTAIDEMNAEMFTAMDDNQQINRGDKNRLPARVSAALTPNMSINLPTVKRSYKRRFDISVKDVPAKTFFMGLVKGTRYSIVVSPDIKGKITLNLKKVTVEDVLKTLEDVYGYGYRRTSVGFEVLANHIETRMYAVNYLDIDRKGVSNTQVSSGQISQGGSGPSSTTVGNATTTTGQGAATSQIGNVETKSNINFWKKLHLTLQSMIGSDEGHSVVVNPQAGLVVVRAYPKEQKHVMNYLDAVQNNMDRQVILEAKILEVMLKDQYQMGIDWKIFGAQLNAINSFPGTDINTTEFPDAFKIDIKWKNNVFETTIQALETQGNIQVLSSPRVATMNNQKSVIKVGTDEFFVTNVSSSTTESVVGTTPTQDVQLTPFFSGISLDVTPQIDARDNVTLHIHPSVSRVVDQNKRIDLGRQNGVLNLPLANSTIRESDTVVHARNGQVIVIGGLMQNQSVEDIAQMPFFGNIPFLGTLLRNTKQQGKKSELVILLRPTVVKKHTWNKKISDAQQRLVGLKKGFHFGGRPDLYGTEGEQPIEWGPKSGTFGSATSK